MDEEKFQRMKADYRNSTLWKIAFIILCFAFMAVMIVVSVNIGDYHMSFGEVWSTIINHILGHHPVPYSKEWYDDYVVWNSRLPRIMFAILAGAALAVQGAAMQSLMKNPLQEPYTTGVSSGASLGVAVTMIVGFTLLPAGLGVGAFIMALVPVAIIILLLPRLNGSVASIILVGTALSYLFNSISTILLVSTDQDTLAHIFRWQVGSLSNITWDKIAVIAAAVIPCSLLIGVLQRRLNIMTMGDNAAQSLGVNVLWMRIICLVAMAVMVGVVVNYAGILGFIGLLCPHIVRLIIGQDNRFLIPASTAFGAAFLLLCDTLAKYVSPIDMVPVGAICGFIGAPLFLFIVLRNRRQIW